MERAHLDAALTDPGLVSERHHLPDADAERPHVGGRGELAVAQRLGRTPERMARERLRKKERAEKERAERERVETERVAVAMEKRREEERV